MSYAVAPVSECLWNMFNARNSGISREQFYANNIVDTTDVLESDMQAANDAIVQYSADNGCYAALPPFEEGSFIDRSERRFVHWKVLEVCEDYFLISFDHYPIIRFEDDAHLGETLKSEEFQDYVQSKCWYKSCHVVVKVKPLTSEEHVAMLEHLYVAEAGIPADTKRREFLKTISDGIRSSSYIGGVVESADSFLPEDCRRIRKKGKYSTPSGEFVDANVIRQSIDATIANRRASGIDAMLYTSTGPIIEMFVYINYMLSQKSTGSSTLRSVNSVYQPSAKQELRKERHFGRIKVVSEKKPRSLNVDNIQRIYKTATWQRRSHLRHYASGKVVPIKSSVCHRQGMGETLASQVVYSV